MKVESGTADHFQHFTGGGLLFEGFGQVSISVLQLLEQPNVLEGDGGLVGEGLQQGDLALGERADLHPADQDRPERGPLAQERHAEGCSVAEAPLVGSPLRKLGLVRFREVAKMDRLPIHNGPAGHRTAVDGDGLVAPGRKNRDRAVSRHCAERATIRAKDDGVLGVAESRGVLRNGVQHRLEVRRRTADNPEDLAGGGLLLQRLGQLSVPSLNLFEQADVLDGDHGLVGEGLDQFNLPGR